MAKGISEQFDLCVENADRIVAELILNRMEKFGDDLIDNILPNQAEYRNLTGNTLTSYGYGLYYNGTVHLISLYRGEPAIRVKLSKGEILRDFEDYDGAIRNYFKADVDTDRNYGSETSYNFLANYKSNAKFSIIVTTGTEQSAYLENVLNLNVLSDGFEFSVSEFMKSFKPI